MNMDFLVNILPRIVIPDEVMLLVSVLLASVLFWYGRKFENYVVGAIGVMFLFRAFYYLVLSLHIEPISSNITLRIGLTRPPDVFAMILLGVFFINGHVNTFIRNALSRLARLK